MIVDINIDEDEVDSGDAISAYEHELKKVLDNNGIIYKDIVTKTPGNDSNGNSGNNGTGSASRSNGRGSASRSNGTGSASRSNGTGTGASK